MAGGNKNLLLEKSNLMMEAKEPVKSVVAIQHSQSKLAGSQSAKPLPKGLAPIRSNIRPQCKGSQKFSSTTSTDDTFPTDDPSPVKSTHKQLQNIKPTSQAKARKCVSSVSRKVDTPTDTPTLPNKVSPTWRTFTDDLDEEVQDYLQSDLPEETPVRTYNLGSMVYSCSSQTLELWPVSNIRSMSRVNLFRTICGMLNTHEKSVICLGVSEMGIALGTPLVREQRDRLRLDLDSVIRDYIIPPLLPVNVDVQFIPVTSESTSSSPVELYVVEIHLFPSPFDIYTLASGTCFLRRGTATEEVGLREVHHMAIAEASKLFLGTFRTLEQEVNRCEEQLRKLANNSK